MNYRIIWQPSAEGQLAEAWLTSRDRTAVAKASYEIDRSLTEDPNSVGESRSDGYRILIELPLVAYYEVREESKTVVVVKVHGLR